MVHTIRRLGAVSTLAMIAVAGGGCGGSDDEESTAGTSADSIVQCLEESGLSVDVLEASQINPVTKIGIVLQDGTPGLEASVDVYPGIVEAQAAYDAGVAAVEGIGQELAPEELRIADNTIVVNIPQSTSDEEAGAIEGCVGLDDPAA